MDYDIKKLKQLNFALKQSDDIGIDDIKDLFDMPIQIIELVSSINKINTNFVVQKMLDFAYSNIDYDKLITYINDLDKKRIFEIISKYCYKNDPKNYNRSIIKGQYNKSKLRYEEKYIGKKYVYDNQILAANKIVNEFFENNKKIVSLIALPQVGKTGTFLYVAYQMATHNSDKILDPENIFIITGMSDIEWQHQTEDDMLDVFKNNVYHHGKLKRFKKDFDKQKGQKLIIIDECHIGSKTEQRMDEILCEKLKIKDIKEILDLDCLILSVSATPGTILMDMQECGNYHTSVYIEPSKSYVGFSKFLEQNRMEKSYPINDEFLIKIKNKIDERYKNNYKYHIFRINNDNGEKLITKFCENNNYPPCLRHNSIDRIDSFGQLLSKKPENHQFILIKQFFRAGKRLSDINIGIAYEHGIGTNMEKTPQGLVGRFCGNDKNKNADNSPYFYCDITAIKDYITFINNGCDFRKADWNSNNLKTRDGITQKRNKTVMSRIKNKDSTNNFISKKDVDIICLDVPIIFDLTKQEYNDIINATNIIEKDKHIKNIISKNNKDLYEIVNKYQRVKITQPESEYSYKRHITDMINASVTKIPQRVDISSKEYKHNNIWLAFIDNEKFNDGILKMIILVYHGERMKNII